MTSIKKAREGGYLKTTPEPEKEKSVWRWLKKAAIILTILSLFVGIIVGLIKIWEFVSGKRENRPDVEQTMTNSPNGIQVAGDNIDVAEVTNNYTFHFNAPTRISFYRSGDTISESQSHSFESLQITLHREKLFEYLPNGLKINNDIIEITSTSRELKTFFNFTKSNFTKTITGKQFKEMNSLLNQILSREPDFAYVWFYKGLLFALASINPEFKDKFSSIAELSFKKANDLFNISLEKYPDDPFLLLYKGMNLTCLNRGEESVSCLKKALSLEPDIFQKKHALGIIVCWKHITPDYLKEWQIAMDKY